MLRGKILERDDALGHEVWLLLRCRLSGGVTSRTNEVDVSVRL